MLKAILRFFGFKPKPESRPSPSSARKNSQPGSRDREVELARDRHQGPAAAHALTAAASPATPSAKEAWEQTAAQRIRRDATPEELCGITAEMSPEAVRGQIAFLYQRHNRAASSLDPTLQAEAEFMLEKLALLREKYIGTPGPP